MLFSALIAAAGFLLGLRVGLGIGYRAERGRRILAERKWLGELAVTIGVRKGELESIDATRARLLGEVRSREANAPQT